MNRFVNKLLDLVSGPEVEDCDAQDYDSPPYDAQDYGYGPYSGSPQAVSHPVSRPSSFTSQTMDAQDYQSLYRAEYGHAGYAAATDREDNAPPYAATGFDSSSAYTSDTYGQAPVAPPPPSFGSRGGSRSAPPPNNIVNLPGLAQQGAEVMVMAPTYFEEMPAAIAALKARKLVVLNLTGMENAQAQRSVDFLAGGTYSIDGDLERIGDNIFLFTPNFVQIRGPQTAAEPAAPAVNPVPAGNGWQASPPPWSPAQMQVG